MGTITVPTNVPDGEVVNINFIDAVDRSGNQTVQFIDGISFVVHNPDGDFTAPVVESFAMTPTTIKPGETVHLEAKLVDDKSGIKSAIVYLINDSNPEVTSVDLKFDEANDVWIAEYVMPVNPLLGTYTVSLEVEDNTRNIASYLQYQTLRVVSEDTDITAPVAPTVDAITDKSTSVTGTTEADAEVTVKIGDSIIGSGKADTEGKFSITMAPQKIGTTISIIARDLAGNESTTDVVTSFQVIRVQLNGVDFAHGYHIDGKTHVNWNALNTLQIPYKDMGNGLFEIGGRNVQAVLVNGDWYIRWTDLSLGKITYNKIAGGYDFIYTPYSPLKVQLNGIDFAQGYHIDGKTHVNWNALNTLQIPYKDMGNGLFEIEGRNVQAVSVSGDWYIRWTDLAPGKVTYQKIAGGYNFIYILYTPVKVQMNGVDFTQGYHIDGKTHVKWNALNTLKIPYIDMGTGLFEIEGRNVQAVSVNRDWYIRWTDLAPGKVTYQKIAGGYNFIYTIYTSVKVQLNGVDFAQGYHIDGKIHVKWNALNTLQIPYKDMGNGFFEIEGRNVQSVSVNGDRYIRWTDLSPGKMSYQKIGGGYNFIYTP